MNLLKFIYTTFFLILLTSCFGSIDKRGTISGFYPEKNLVKTIGGKFKIGPLPSPWKKEKIEFRALYFINEIDSSSITVSSWCKGAFDDGRLKDLSRRMTRGITEIEIIEHKTTQIDLRDAMQQSLFGKMDGVPIYMKTYVMKKNECVFDFIYVTIPNKREYEKDFDNMVHGFEYIKGPKIM